MLRPQSILILSGGLDSAVSSAIAVEKTKPILALTFNYGQKAAMQEINAASKIAAFLKVPHKTIQIPWLAELTKTALVSPQKNPPKLDEASLSNKALVVDTAAQVWVPNRNGLFLNIAATFAESLDAPWIVTGFNKEEAMTFPDNSSAFIQTADEFFRYSTQTKVRVTSYTLEWDKVEIAKQAKERHIPIQDLWFCYLGEEKPCTTCESCVRDFRALRIAGIPNPWKEKK